jgi:hypothetical protein
LAAVGGLLWVTKGQRDLGILLLTFLNPYLVLGVHGYDSLGSWHAFLSVDRR